MVETSFAAKYCANQRSNPLVSTVSSPPAMIRKGSLTAIPVRFCSIIYGQNTSHDLTLSNSSNNTGPHTLTDIPDTKHTVLAVRHTRAKPAYSPVRHSL